MMRSNSNKSYTENARTMRENMMNLYRMEHNYNMNLEVEELKDKFFHVMPQQHLMRLVAEECKDQDMLKYIDKEFYFARVCVTQIFLCLFSLYMHYYPFALKYRLGDDIFEERCEYNTAVHDLAARKGMKPYELDFKDEEIKKEIEKGIEAGL